MIKIYGIPKEIGFCYACNEAEKYCINHGIQYEFIPVLRKTTEGFDYNKDTIISLAKRLNRTSLSIMYPQIFEDDLYIGNLRQFKDYWRQNEQDYS